MDIFSLIYYTYRKIPEPDPDRFYRLFPLVAYPFSYPFFASLLSFPKEYTIVIGNKNFSEKFLFFSDPFLFVPCKKLLLSMCHIWPAGVFLISSSVLIPSGPDGLPHIRAPPLLTPSGRCTSADRLWCHVFVSVNSPQSILS